MCSFSVTKFNGNLYYVKTVTFSQEKALAFASVFSIKCSCKPEHEARLRLVKCVSRVKCASHDSGTLNFTLRRPSGSPKRACRVLGNGTTPQYFTVSGANDHTCAFGASFTIEKNTFFEYYLEKGSTNRDLWRLGINGMY